MRAGSYRRATDGPSVRGDGPSAVKEHRRDADDRGNGGADEPGEDAVAARAPRLRRRGPFGPLLLSVCAWLPRGGAYANLGTSLTASAIPRGMTRLALRVTPLHVPRRDCA